MQLDEILALITGALFLDSVFVFTLAILLLMQKGVISLNGLCYLFTNGINSLESQLMVFYNIIIVHYCTADYVGWEAKNSGKMDYIILYHIK